jgi:hypothetical protein
MVVRQIWNGAWVQEVEKYDTGCHQRERKHGGVGTINNVTASGANPALSRVSGSGKCMGREVETIVGDITQFPDLTVEG